ncbi:uncharacterized protein [Choristoneura fumiferana]|uniref:uncharacterized protein n=1 Tax=Choristoneura fumiferana TaxID=7141 RepID=UPI003D15D7D9
MAHQLSRREAEELRPSLDRAIYRTIGKSDSSLLSTVSYCLTSGYERRKIIDKISSHIDSKKASKLADKILALAQELVSSSKSTKRKHESEEKRDSKRSKHEEKEEKKPEEKEKNGNGVEPVEITPLALPVGETIGSKITGLSADRIKVMMANAQKEIEERKRALTAMKGGGVSGAAAAAQQIKAALPARALAPPSVIKPVLYSKPAVSAGVTAEELEKQRKIAELQARIQKKLAGGAIPAGPTGPAPLILDREGRTVDTSGRRVQLTHVAPTLKRSPPGATGPAPLILDREGRTVDTSGRRVQLTHVAPTLKGTAPLACSGARRGPTGPAPLILDREGRTVDTSGRRVQLTHVAPTLKRSPPGATGPAPLILDREGRTVDTSGRRVQLTHVAPTLKRSPPGATGPAPLILDREGRTVDTSGRRVQLTHVAPTLKVPPPYGARRGATGPAPLILDREGRTVDTSGRRVQLTHVAPTLKANIRAKRREEFRAQLSGAATSEPAADASWVDPRVALKAPARARRALRFHEPGKFRQQAERLRMKAQLEKLQNEISQIARKTGISSATKLALLASDKAEGDRVPDIEWKLTYKDLLDIR